MRLVLTMILGLALAACGSSSPAPVAQQAAQTGGPATAAVNAIRGQTGASGITRSPALDAAAKAHADDMAAKNFFSHTGSSGSSAGQRVTAAGYKWCLAAENIAKGQSSQAEVIAGWQRSPSHYRNMVNPKAREFGLARTGDYWVMVLAAKRC